MCAERSMSWLRRSWLPLMITALSLQALRAPAAQSSGSQEPATLAIVDGRLIDGHGGAPLEDSVILIRGNRIAAVGELGRLQVPEGTRIVSSDGTTVMPGLIDLHVHHQIIGHNDYDHRFAAHRDNMRTVVMPLAAKILLHAGVTSARDLGNGLR